jgi:alkanesulfonate monooxygenase SsuD/methylene tetrahydromethanopterin reductase-like flavin-dependent oxidoreductase (luciferase family)
MAMAGTPGEHPIVIGVESFGEMTVGGDGHLLSEPENIRELVAEGVLAEGSGLDFFGLGEHHIEEIPLPAPDMVLAAIAARTSRIHLGSAVTVLSSDDPVRVFQRYATLDAVSSGRAEVILGRGSNTESFPLFGFDLADYERLFDEKLELFALLRQEKPVTWAGTTRAALGGLQVYPHTASGALPTWVGVGGNPASVVRAARYGFSLMLAIIGGNPARFARLSELFRQATAQAGHAGLPIGVHSPGHVAATDARAKEEYWPTYQTFLLETRDHPRVLRARGGIRLPLRGVARDRRPAHRQDHDHTRRQPLRPEVRHGPDGPRHPDGEHPPLRHRGGPASTRTTCAAAG